MIHRFQGVFVAATTCLSLATAPAFAEDVKETARTTLVKGHDLYEGGKYRDALAHIMTSWSLLKMPFTALWAARTNEKLHELVSAAKMYREAVSLVPDPSWPKDPQKRQAQEQAKRDAQVELSVLLPRIPTLAIEITGANTAEIEVTIDGTKVPADALAKPQELDPGNHTVSVSSHGGEPQSQTVTLAERDRKTVKFELAQLAAPPMPPVVEPKAQHSPPIAVLSPPRGNVAPHKPQESQAGNKLPTVVWVGVEVGAAGLVLGTTAGIVAWSKQGLADCDGNNFCKDYERYHESYNTWRNVSTVGFVVGGVGAATAGVAWLVMKPKRGEAQHISMSLGPGTVGMHGAF